MLKQVNGKWALVSKKTQRPLAYYKGNGKPSEDWVKKQESRIQMFKSMNEQKDSTTKSGSGLTIFDIDDTLFHTTAKIAVKKGGKVVRELNNQEFNTYQLKKGEEFDYRQFRDAKKFKEESKPIAKMFAKAKAILRNVVNKPGSQMIILTARNDFDDKETFLDTFRQYGLDIDKVRVERAGKLTKLSPAHAKYVIIYNYLKQGKFSHVRLFDDSMANLKEFLRLKKDFTDVTFEAYFAKPDGSVERIGGINEEQEFVSKAGAGEWGRPELTRKYIEDTPGQKVQRFKKYIKNI